MSNELTYAFTAQEVWDAKLCASRFSINHVSSPQDCSAAEVAAILFSDALIQHSLWIGVGTDVEAEFDGHVIRPSKDKDGSPAYNSAHIIKLTFKEEATALLFKLSHDAGAK